MEKSYTPRDIINLWPTRAALAEDISAVIATTVSSGKVHKWAANQSIPAMYHDAVVRAAHRRGYDLSAERLMAAHAFRPKRAAPAQPSDGPGSGAAA
jgi:hypothetical protein